jgi:hypothetical protein
MDYARTSIEKEQYHLEHEALKERLLSYYKEMDSEDRIEHSGKFGGHYEANDYEEYIQDKFTQPYEEAFFWDELIDRLGQRDLVNAVGMEQFRKMEFVEQMRRLDEMKERYANEFEQHGLANLKINK